MKGKIETSRTGLNTDLVNHHFQVALYNIALGAPLQVMAQIESYAAEDNEFEEAEGIKLAIEAVINNESNCVIGQVFNSRGESITGDLFTDDSEDSEDEDFDDEDN